MSKWKVISLVVLGIAVICALLVSAAPIRGMINQWRFGIQKVDDRTSYEAIKKVEDACRAMIASYNTDKLTYEQYKDSDNAEKQSWGEQAKMRANKTASTYNNYVLENNFLWQDNVPSDIYHELPYLK